MGVGVVINSQTTQKTSASRKFQTAVLTITKDARVVGVVINSLKTHGTSASKKFQTAKLTMLRVTAQNAKTINKSKTEHVLSLIKVTKIIVLKLIHITSKGVWNVIKDIKNETSLRILI